MHNLIKIQETIAWKPNDMKLKTENEIGTLEYLLFTSFFTVPIIFDQDDDVRLEVDINTITEKKLQGSICTQIKNACEKVSKWQLEIPGNGRTRYEFINLFISIKRHKNQIIAIISKKVVPYLKEHFLKGFTKIPMEYARKLNTYYQMKIFSLCLQFKNCKNPVFEINWFKSYLGIYGDKYKKYSHLKNRIITSSFKIINSETPIKISLKEIKKGNEVIALKLINNPSKNPEADEIVCECDKEFEFASDCFNQLTPENKKIFFNGSELFNCDEYRTLHAISAFQSKYREILKNNKTIKEVLIAINDLL